MIEAGGGAIVNIASINGIAAAPNAGAYTASKAGIIMLTEQMALEWSAGVRVNCVAPGLINAGMSDADLRRPGGPQAPQAGSRSAGSAPPRTSPTPCCSSAPQAALHTGQTIAVDGGITKAALATLPRPERRSTRWA